jgi:hypothetical protein
VTQAHTAEDVFSALHAGRIKGVMSEETLSGFAPAPVIESLMIDGLMRVGTRGAMLTPAGLEQHSCLLAEQRAGVDLPALAATYATFMVVNKSVLAVCAAWQESEGDEEALFHTAHLLDDYLGLAIPALMTAAAMLPRFGVYAERLVVASRRALAGEAPYVTNPHVDSFHNAWFECHEDYLITLERGRSEAQAAQGS